MGEETKTPSKRKPKRELVGRETSESVSASNSKVDGARPKQQRLAGMEDHKIPELHKLAEEYIEVRDRRMALTDRESKCGDLLLAAMKKYQKERYCCDGIELTVVHTDERVKARTIKEEDE